MVVLLRCCCPLPGKSTSDLSHVSAGCHVHAEIAGFLRDIFIPKH